MSMSCFVDCDSSEIVIRIPQQLAVQLVSNSLEIPEVQELIPKLITASYRSSNFRNLLIDAGLTPFSK